MSFLKKYQNVLLSILYIVLGLGYLIFAYSRTIKEGIGGDVHVFWQAGVNFIQGTDLYYVPAGMRNFIYPPFAALFFSGWALFPFKVATYLLFLINGALWYYSFILIKKICLQQELSLLTPKFNTFLLFSFFLSFKLYWNNITTIQVNDIVFVLSLLGIYYFLKNKDIHAIVLVGMATAIKVVPIFILGWMILRKKDIRFFLYALFAGLCFLLLPWMLRGYELGLHDILEFYRVTLDGFFQGNVHKSYANQNWSTFIYHIFGPPTGVNDVEFTILELAPSTLTFIRRCGIIIFLLTIFTSSMIMNFKEKEPNIFEVVPYIIASHLLSGSTWKAHLVTLSLAFILLFLPIGHQKCNMNYFRYFIIGMATLLAFTGKAIVGRLGMVYVGGYGGYVILMILMFLYFTIVLFHNGWNASSAKQATPNEKP